MTFYNYYWSTYNNVFNWPIDVLLTIRRSILNKKTMAPLSCDISLRVTQVSVFRDINV